MHTANIVVSKRNLINWWWKRPQSKDSREKWSQLTRKYNLEMNRFMKRLYKHRAMWAKPYFMDIFCAGMTSTQRSREC
jgi:hypothetical protein